MKRVFSVLLVACLCCGMLVGCGGNEDVTKLPHNHKISITDKKSTIDEIEEIQVEDAISYTLLEPVKIDGKSYQIRYEFSNVEPDNDFISSVYYDSTEVRLEDAIKYIDNIYGELKKDETPGKYGPGQDGRYIIQSEGKVWTVGCFDTYNGATRIIISRDMTLE